MRQPKRDIKRVFVHCTGTRPSATVESVKQGFRRLGWANPGYHFLVDQWGVIHTLLPIDRIANGVRGYNATAVHVAYIGGLNARRQPADTRTVAQARSLRAAVRALLMDYPGAQVLGHRDISPDLNGNGIVDPWERIKECPCFDVATDL